MTHEEMERSMEFILQQQVKFASDLQQLSSFGSELARAQIRTQNELADLAEAHKRTDAKFGELADAQKRTDAKVGELADAQKRTEERLDVFITFVERYLRGNGKDRKPE